MKQTKCQIADAIVRSGNDMEYIFSNFSRSQLSAILQFGASKAELAQMLRNVEVYREAEGNHPGEFHVCTECKSTWSCNDKPVIVDGKPFCVLPKIETCDSCRGIS